MYFFDEFKKFAMRGNVIDLAVGFIMGGTFNHIVTSLVNDILMPPIGWMTSGLDFTSLAFVIQKGTETTEEVAIHYGSFFNAVVHFLIVAFATFLLVKVVNRIQTKEEKKAPSTKKCPECQMDIPLAAKRCGHCTAVLQEAKEWPPTHPPAAALTEK